MNLLDLLPAGIAPEDVATLMSAAAAFGTVYAVWQALVVRDPMAARAKALSRQRQTLRGELLAVGRNRTRQAEAMHLMRGVTARLNLLRSKHAEGVQAKLTQAGWRSRDAMVTFLFCKLALPFAMGGFGLLFFYGLGALDLPPLARLAATMGLVVIGAYLPELAVRNAASKRRAALQKGLPDALDLLVICAEAGLSLDAALTRVSREMGRSSPEIADEFGLTAIELGFLPDRKVALGNLAGRCNLPSIRGVVNTLMQTEKYGTPLSQSLRVLAAEFRDERMMKAEEKAARLPATMTIPLILFILPSLFVVLLGPAIIRAIDGLRGM